MATSEPGATAASSLSAEQLSEVLPTVKDGMCEEISKFKRENKETADEQPLKKLKQENPPVFKKKSHEKQYYFNEEVTCKFDAATAALSETPPAVEIAKMLLEEGAKLVRERQKLIRIADRSKHGWASVGECLEDELAENSDDEKRI